MCSTRVGLGAEDWRATPTWNRWFPPRPHGSADGCSCRRGDGTQEVCVDDMRQQSGGVRTSKLVMLTSRPMLTLDSIMAPSMTEFLPMPSTASPARLSAARAESCGPPRRAVASAARCTRSPARQGTGAGSRASRLGEWVAVGAPAQERPLIRIAPVD